MAQIIINRFPIPSEIQDIIKDFTLPSIKRDKIMAIQKQLFYIIKYFKTENVYYYPKMYFKEIDKFHKTFKHIDKRVCSVCGNYYGREIVYCIC